MGRIAADWSDLAIATSDNPRTEDPEAIIDEIERGMGGAPHLRIPDRLAAIRAALNEGQAGDTGAENGWRALINMGETEGDRGGGERQEERQSGRTIVQVADQEASTEGLLADARSTRAAVAAARDARAAYLAGLRRQQQLNDAQISKLSAQATAASDQSDELSDNTGGTTVPPAPPGHGTKMRVSSTGYCLQGNTATGVPTSPGVVAVDPTVIPLGTRMSVPGYGEGVAADTGSAVKGRMIDVWFTSCADAMAWGRKTVTITLH